MSSGRWGARTPYYQPAKSWNDPLPAGGDSERVYCTLRARFGEWPRDFYARCPDGSIDPNCIVARVYKGRVPPRFERRAAIIAGARPWESSTPEARRGDPPEIRIQLPDRLVIFKPSAEEWRDARDRTSEAQAAKDN